MSFPDSSPLPITHWSVVKLSSVDLGSLLPFLFNILLLVFCPSSVPHPVFPNLLQQSAFWFQWHLISHWMDYKAVRDLTHWSYLHCPCAHSALQLCWTIHSSLNLPIKCVSHSFECSLPLSWSVQSHLFLSLKLQVILHNSAQTSLPRKTSYDPRVNHFLYCAPSLICKCLIIILINCITIFMPIVSFRM